jgi:hypothetical protein
VDQDLKVVLILMKHLKNVNDEKKIDAQQIMLEKGRKEVFD